MNEMKTRDVSEIKQPEAQGFREIKPETNMSASIARSFIDNEFASMDSKEQQQKTYYDDNGEKYREGDSLLPNITFEVNGYKYKTDDYGRPISAEGNLKLRDPEYKRTMNDSMEAVGKGDQKENDQRGHLIAHRFGGSDGIENLVAMAGKLNQGDYAKLENTISDAIEKDGADVNLKVEPIYKGDSNRPDEFRVSYSIDGDKDVVVFKNRSDA